MVNFSVNLKPSLVSFIVLIFLLLDASSLSYASNRVVEIGEICKQTINPSVCSRVLNPKQGADLVTLEGYTIGVTGAKVRDTINLIKGLIAKTTDPGLSSHYKTCLAHFDEALDDINYARENLNKGDYLGVNVAASSADEDVDDCVSGDSPSDPPVQDPSVLPQYATLVQQEVRGVKNPTQGKFS
ncbi:hypothetical protein PIB30_085287 [Stylosanthes scabra]|uniref:Pectinesterase inhibitor domain-containing protein n=1 Tax=Stylosanthes scabra TaxID=79078 RepID=A0ABU6ZRJ4_9FABA|nr:hypothetical protein [Stylosanthes scabra]